MGQKEGEVSARSVIGKNETRFSAKIHSFDSASHGLVDLYHTPISQDRGQASVLADPSESQLSHSIDADRRKPEVLRLEIIRGRK